MVDKTKKAELAWFTTDSKKNLLTRAVAGDAFNSAGVKFPAGMKPAARAPSGGASGVVEDEH